MAAEAAKLDVRVYLGILWRRKWVIFCAFVLGALLGLYFALTAKPSYQVKATVLLREIEIEFSAVTRFGPKVSGAQDLDLLKAKILSTAVLGELIKRAGLQKDSLFLAEAREIARNSPRINLDEIMLSLLIEKLRAKILRVRVHGDNMIEIVAEHQDPEVAHQLVSLLVDIFVEQTRQTEASGLQSGLTYSSEQLEIYKKRLEQAEARLRSLKAGSAIDKLGQQPASHDGHAERLRAFAQAATNQLEIEKRIFREAAARLSDQGATEQKASSPAIEKLHGQQMEKLAQLANALSANDGSEEQIYRINSEIKELDADMQKEALRLAAAQVGEADRQAMAERLMADRRIQFFEKKKQSIDRLLEDYLQSRKAAFKQQPLQAMNEERLRDEVEQARQVYQMFLKQKQGAEMEAALQAARSPYLFRIIEPPQKPLASTMMSKRARLLIGSALGFGVGLVLAFGLEEIDQSIKAIDDVERHLEVPVFGLMPRIDRKDFSFDLSEKESVDIQRIVSKLVKQFARSAPANGKNSAGRNRTILVTSSVLGEGKSIFSAHLAACSALMLKPSMVLLIDADLRRGIQHRIFECANQRGLANLLEEQAEVAAQLCLQTTLFPKLYLLTSGHSQETPLTLLNSDRSDNVIAQLKTYFDFIIIDSPPVIPVNDALILSRHADTALYVVKAGATPREVVKRGAGLMRATECHFSGIILNNVKQVLPYYYRHDYYNYQYEKPQAPAELEDESGQRMEKQMT
jgi:capsular exopolysaccharide synthesis family protein